MSDNHIHPSTRPATKNVDRAGGVPTPRWHVAIVNHNAEHTIARTIAAQGIPTYVASQPQLRIWRDGRRRHIDHVVIPSTIFIHCTEPQRRTLLQTTPGLHRFLIDRATATPPRPATIPDQQIQRLRFMLGATDTPVEFIPRPLTPGQHITVIRGPLRGLHAEILTTPTPSSTSSAPTTSPTSTTDNSST
ncbi:transcription termination/antitermination NusG family protein, partial [Paramuribaculum intestinale]